MVIDYYSRFFELESLQKTTPTAIVMVLSQAFARFGIPKFVRSNSGRQFTSAESQTHGDSHTLHQTPISHKATGRLNELFRQSRARYENHWMSPKPYFLTGQRLVRRLLANQATHGTRLHSTVPLHPMQLKSR